MAILIFDYDGTLHDSMHIYGPAVRKCHETLASAGLVERRKITDEEIHSYLGLSIEEMWFLFAPELSKEERAEGGRFIGSELRSSVMAGKAVLYEGALETLKALKKAGHRLVYLSNCTESYKELHRKAFDLDRYFDEMYCSEEFGWKEKFQIAEELLEKWQQEKRERHCDNEKLPEDKAADEMYVPETMQVIAIGDRYKDINMGKIRSRTGKIKTIWCAYGFGRPEEGSDADAVAESVDDIFGLVQGLFPSKRILSQFAWSGNS